MVPWLLVSWIQCLPLGQALLHLCRHAAALVSGRHMPKCPSEMVRQSCYETDHHIKSCSVWHGSLEWHGIDDCPDAHSQVSGMHALYPQDLSMRAFHTNRQRLNALPRLDF